MGAMVPSQGAMQFIDLDFTPGIFSDTHSEGGLRSAPDGAATTNTFGCYGTPYGGLAPTPRPSVAVQDTFTVSSISTLMGGGTVTKGTHRTAANNNTGGNGKLFLVDARVASPVIESNDGRPGDAPFAVYSTLYSSGGGGVGTYLRENYLYRGIPTRTGMTRYAENLTGGGVLAAIGALVAGPGSLDGFLADPSSISGTAVRLPTIVGIIGNPRGGVLANSPDSDYFAFPNGSGPTSDSPLQADGASRHAIFSHQGVLVALTDNATTGAFGFTGVTRSGEAIVYGSYSDSENVPGSTPLYLAEENPSGYGSWASLNANELFMVKHRGGGVLVRGDLETPTVIRLPNIHSTHGLTNVGAAVPGLGYVYFSAFGAFSWNGEDTSKPIAAQLHPTFWVSDRAWTGAYIGKEAHDSSGIAYGVAGLVGRATYASPFLFAPNGYVMHEATGGWWQIEVPSDTDPAITHWDVSAVSPKVWGFYDWVDDNYLTAARAYDLRYGAYAYQYESQPLTPSRDRYIEVREFYITINGTSGSTIAVSFIGIDDAGHVDGTQVETIGLTATGVSMHRVSTALVAAQVQVKIAATAPDSDTDAPRILSFRVGWQPGPQL